MKHSESVTFCGYSGGSMQPTLRDGDLVEVLPLGSRTIHVGDVLLFPSPENGQLIIHRVSGLTPQGIRTRGDHNQSPDAWLLWSDRVIGHVIAAWTGQRRRSIHGGWRGRWIARFITWRTRITRPDTPLWRMLPGILNRFSPLNSLLSLTHQASPGLFHINGKPSLRLLVRQQVIGWYIPDQRQWYVRWPYRLWVDTHKLPFLSEELS